MKTTDGKVSTLGGMGTRSCMPRWRVNGDFRSRQRERDLGRWEISLGDTA